MTTHRLALRTQWFLAVALAAAAGTLTACDRHDEAAKAIEAAERRVAVLTSAGGAVNPFDDVRRKELTELVGSVKSYLDVKAAGQARAANLIAAQATASMADLDLQAATEAETQAAAKIQQVREALETWTTQSARAKSEESFDPAPQLAELDTQIADLDKQIAAKNAAKAKLEGELAAMTRDADGKIAEAKKQREQASALQRQVEGGTATAGLRLVQEAAKIRAAADSLDTAASGLNAQVRVMRPQVDQFTRDVAALQRNRESLVQGKAGLSERKELAAKSAAEARTVAQQASARIDAVVGDVKNLRSSTLMATTDKAIKGYSDAAAMAAKAVSLASGADANSAKLSNALYQQGLGQAKLVKARELDAEAGVMSLLGSATPPLASASQFQAAAKELRDQADAVIGEVKEAFGKAWAVYETAKDSGGAGELFKARMESATSKLKLLAGEKPATPEPAAAPAAAAATGDKPADAGGTKMDAAAAEAGAKAFVDKYHDAMRNRDFDAMSKLTQASDSERAGMVDVGAMISAIVQLDEACKTKFGKPLNDVLAAGDQGLAGMAANFTKAGDQFKMQQDRTSADYTYAVADDGKVTVTAKQPYEGERDSVLVNVNGTWFAVLREDERGSLAGAGTLAKPIAGVMGSLAADVKSGKIADEQALRTQLTMKLMSAMGGMGGNRGPRNRPTPPDPNK